MFQKPQSSFKNYDGQYIQLMRTLFYDSARHKEVTYKAFY